MQEQWPFGLSPPEKFNVGPLEGELPVTTPLHLWTDTHTQDNFISSSLDFFYCPEKANKIACTIKYLYKYFKVFFMIVSLM